jgi:hypothetical protein
MKMMRCDKKLSVGAGWHWAVTVYTQSKRTPSACSSSIYLERDSRPSVDSMAQRVFEVAGRDLFRQKSRDVDGQGYIRFCVVFAMGIIEFPSLDWQVRE